MLAVAAAAPVTTLTRFDVAVPFWVAAVLVVVGAVFGDFVTAKVSTELKDVAKKTGEDLTSHGDAFQPDAMELTSTWAVDTAGVVPAVLAPLIGLVLLWKQGARAALVLVLIVIVAVAVGIYGYFWKKSSWEYASGWPWIFTPITVLALVLNAVGGGIAFAIGP